MAPSRSRVTRAPPRFAFLSDVSPDTLARNRAFPTTVYTSGVRVGALPYRAVTKEGDYRRFGMRHRERRKRWAGCG